MRIPQQPRSSNTVGFDQRHDMPELDEHDAWLIEQLKKAPATKYLPWNDPLWLKKFLERSDQGVSDAQQAAEHSINTTPQQDALLRQSSLDDESASDDKSASLSREFDDAFWQGNNPEKWRRAQMRKL